jgi:hypothetical protein
MFVVVLVAGWDSSTWMAEEANYALTMPRVVAPLPGFFWNPTRVSVRARGMVGYLKTELPVSVEDAVAVLLEEAGRITTSCS